MTTPLSEDQLSVVQKHMTDVAYLINKFNEHCQSEYIAKNDPTKLSDALHAATHMEIVDLHFQGLSQQELDERVNALIVYFQKKCVHHQVEYVIGYHANLDTCIDDISVPYKKTCERLHIDPNQHVFLELDPYVHNTTRIKFCLDVRQKKKTDMADLF